MDIRAYSLTCALLLGGSTIAASPASAAPITVASANFVSNNVEFDQFDDAGLLTGGFYLHTSSGGLGAEYFTAFAFDGAGTLRVAHRNTVSNNIEVDAFDHGGALTTGFYLHTSSGGLGAGYFSTIAFDPAGNLWTASKNTVSNNVEIDKFDNAGLLTTGFYLHTSINGLGAGYLTDFAFDPEGHLWVANQNTVSNNIELDEFDSTGLLTNGFYLHTSSGGLGAGYFKDFAFDPSGNLWVAFANTVSNNVEIDRFDNSGLLQTGFYLHTSAGGLGASYFSAFDFSPAVDQPPPDGAVPEPPTWAMMFAGATLLGAISRRRSRRGSLPAARRDPSAVT